MKTNRIALLKAAAMMLAMLGTVQAATVCPTADLTGDCFVDMVDFSVLAKNWLADCDASSGFCGGADFDESGEVTNNDVLTFVFEWLDGERPQDCPSADLTGDCFVDMADYAVLAKNWLADCDASSDFCGGADFDASGKVTGSDAVTFALEWMEGQRPDVPSMIWIAVNDPGVPGHEGFQGQMSKFETTNAQYALFLNAALATGDCVVDGSTVIGADGSNPGADYIGWTYYQLDGPGESFDGATRGGSSKIVYAGGAFRVEAGFEDHPVTYVAWYGAAAFCSYYGWRLPTEWQWQAAADYDGAYNYGCGVTINPGTANYRTSLHPHGTTPAGAFGHYGYGLADMAGNVWEWTNTAAAGYRVLRGGSWYYTDYSSKVTTRLGLYPQNTYPDAGFRPCR